VGAVPAGPVIACTTHSFGSLPLATAFRLIHALDIRHVDLVAQPPGRQLEAYEMAADPAGEARRLGDMAASAGVTLSGCFVLGFRERLVDHDPEARRRLPDLFGAIARCARGCGIVHVQAASGQPNPALTPDEQFAVVAENARAVQAAVAGEGCELLLEAQRGAAVESPDATHRLLQAVPGLRLNHDPGQFECAGFGQDSYESLYAHTAHIHMRQARNGWIQERLAAGSINFRRVVRDLQQVGFTGVYATEYVHVTRLWDMCNVDVVTETAAMRDLILEELAAIAAEAA
jgi:sugar phosphate isomerase/epimerase